MPTHKIHLVIASKVNKILKLDNDSFLLGNVLPDLTINKNHGLSHYQIEGSYEDELANPNKFIEKYGKELNKHVMMGYLVHLLTDKYYNDIFFKKYCIFNENGKPFKVKLKIGITAQPIKKYKHNDFNKYDQYLLKKGLVPKFDSVCCVDNVKDLSIAKFNKENLITYIKINNEEVKNHKLHNINTSLFYKVISRKELDFILNNCCDYIINYIKNANL